MSQQFNGHILNHHNAHVEIRGKVAFSDKESTRFIQFFKDEGDCSDMMIVSTCNRTEIYYTSENDISDKVLGMIKVTKNVNDDVISFFEHLKDLDAIRHLHRVSVGLDSSILGDLQITAQIKEAYQRSADLQVAGPFLHRLMHSIFFAHKKIAHETDFKMGMASLSYAAADLAKRKSKEFLDAKILIIGAGEMGKDIVKNLTDISEKISVTITNRTYEKAASLAAIYGLELLHFEKLTDCINQYDIIISGISIDTPLIKSKNLHNKNSLRHKYILDLGIPRNAEEGIENNPGIISYHVDEIQLRISDDSKKRLSAVPHVEQILNESIINFNDWSAELMVSPTIHSIKKSLEDIRQKELSKYIQKVDNKTIDLMDELTQGMVKKMLNVHVLQLKAACKRGEAETLIDVLNDLFNLEKTPIKK